MATLGEFWFNTSFHSSLSVSPFEVLYGRQPRMLGISPATVVSHVDLHSLLSQRELMTQSIRQHLLRAQQRMKHQADKNRMDRFTVGDLVCLKLQPYIQSSVVVRANHKLSYKYFSPYRITTKINSVAYKLELPLGLYSSHFHVSQLKACVPPTVPVGASLPDANIDMQVPI